MSNDGTGFEKVVVRRTGDLDVETGSEPPEIRGSGDYGYGSDLQTPAFDGIHECLDPDEHDAKTHVATIWYDLDAWEYTSEYSGEGDR
ncbi:hypothetical protein Htur_5005 (plasmid) [Haloterrigena turkmenica DSM 5511]|uniref:Uncharacterized protein n=1 Tax=Haloterrigena turkmenica (strain ATCC 51198 / DSM 5511 / JCM 9101 / NCIMB 13204 / VKM B-1734 / 4k) TaxID=543526 RepID=D2S2Y7_HALTV|nr:hypothetical protein Htur_5005 [Haloterrigena turkmenica DSM 5511]